MTIQIFFLHKFFLIQSFNRNKIKKIQENQDLLNDFCQRNSIVNLPNRIPQLNIICIIYIIKLFIRLNFESMQDKTLINYNILKKFCLL